ncbi:MAG: hypothetical protein ACTS6P_01805 [Candidatus Hodgkinia cicadicola]
MLTCKTLKPSFAKHVRQVSINPSELKLPNLDVRHKTLPKAPFPPSRGRQVISDALAKRSRAIPFPSGGHLAAQTSEPPPIHCARPSLRRFLSSRSRSNPQLPLVAFAHPAASRSKGPSAASPANVRSQPIFTSVRI